MGCGCALDASVQCAGAAYLVVSRAVCLLGLSLRTPSFGECLQAQSALLSICDKVHNITCDLQARSITLSPSAWCRVLFDPSYSFAPCQRRDATTPATTRRPSSCKLRRGELQSKGAVKGGRRDPPLCQKVKDRCLLSERLSDVAEWAASDRGELHCSAQELPRQCCCRQPGEFGMPED